jgi:hypothetical protein
MGLCIYCKEPLKYSNLGGYCQPCYRYFVLDKGIVYDTPPYGEIWYAPNGDCICPICGKAFRKLGCHLYNFHKITSREAYQQFGWAFNVKASNLSYRYDMKQKLKDYCVDINLIERGKNTRFVVGSPGRTTDKVSEMTRRRLKLNRIKKGGD